MRSLKAREEPFWTAGDSPAITSCGAQIGSLCAPRRPDLPTVQV
jgi:hypothetical protein